MIEVEPRIALARLFQIDPETITTWSDDSLTIEGEHCEYQLSKRPRKGLMECLGKQDGYWIYRN